MKNCVVGGRLVFTLLCMFPLSLLADDCLQFKKIPRVILDVPDWNKTVVQPKESMDMWHGNVVATLIDNYNIGADVNKVNDGYCVGIKSVDAVVGYNDFVVQIDITHKPNSCQYNAILAHEDKHIKTYLSVIDDFKPDLQKSVFAAADSIMPIFVKDIDDVDVAVNNINNKLQNHPDLIIVKQKLRAAEEIRNKKIDQDEDNKDLKKCL